MNWFYSFNHYCNCAHPNINTRICDVVHSRLVRYPNEELEDDFFKNFY